MIYKNIPYKYYIMNMNKTIVLPQQLSYDNNSTTSEIEMTPDSHARSTEIEKKKQKRVVTTTTKWRFTEEDYTKENQIILLKSIQNINKENNLAIQQKCVLQQLAQKIAGYKSQDIAKDLYNPILFITLERVIELLIESDLLCHYCKNDVKVLYEIVREPLQWTLDRIDNDYGHNTGNLFVACLSCNLRWKTIYHERYVMNKICTNVIKLS